MRKRSNKPKSRITKTLSPEQLKNEGNTFAKDQKYLEALEKYEAAIEGNPNFAVAHFNAGLMHKKLNRFAEAEAAFRKTLLIDPTYKKAQWNLFITLVLSKQFQEAESLYQKFSDTDREHEEIVLAKYRLDQQTQAHVGFLTFDVKLTEQGIKILEIRDGMCSEHKNDGSDPCNHPLLAFKQALQAWAAQPVFVTTAPGAPPIESVNIPETLRTQFATLPELFDPKDLASYRAVVAGDLFGIALPQPVLKVNRSCGPVLSHPLIQHEIFRQSDQTVLRPLSKIYRRYYSTKQVNQILADFPKTDWLVFKTGDPNHDHATLFVKRTELDQTLQLLFSASKNQESPLFIQKLRELVHFDPRQGEPTPDQKARIHRILLWCSSDETDFLIEAYVSNRVFEYQGQLYNPTLRVSCLTQFSRGVLTVKPLDAFWRIPPKPITAHCTIIEKTVPMAGLDRSIAPVNAADEAQIFQTIESILPSLFLAMRAFDAVAWVLARPEQTLSEKKIKAMQLIHLANHCLHDHDFSIVDLLHQKIKFYVYEEARLEHEQGLRYQIVGNHPQAVMHFQKALSMDATFEPAYYRSAQSYFELGQEKLGYECCNECLKLNPDYKIKIAQLVHSHRTRQPATVSVPTPVLPGIILSGSDQNCTEARPAHDSIAIIDLHGEGVESAKQRVMIAIFYANANRQTKIRFVTGRGNHLNSQGHSGTLFQLFPQWIETIKAQAESLIAGVDVFDGYYEVSFSSEKRSILEKEQLAMLDAALSESFDEVLSDAKEGSVEAQRVIAYAYQEGKFIQQDYKQAFFWFEKAAQQEDPIAIYELGHCYYQGRGVRQNDPKAFDCYRRSVDAPSHLLSWNARHQLAHLYAFGQGVTKNLVEAHRLYQSVADSGIEQSIVTDSARKVGYNYYRGLGVEVNVSLAMRYYHQAADTEPGDSTAQFNLANFYYEGKIVPKDNRKALDYFSLAASNGDGDAYLFIAEFYRHGIVYKKDLKAACEQLKQGANLHSARSAFAIFEISELPLDFEERFNYLTQAANLNYAPALVMCFELSQKIRESNMTLFPAPLFSERQKKAYKQQLTSLSADEIEGIPIRYQTLILTYLFAWAKSKTALQKIKGLCKELVNRNQPAACRVLGTYYHNLGEHKLAQMYFEQGSAQGDDECQTHLATYFSRAVSLNG